MGTWTDKFRPTDFNEEPEALKTWSQLRGDIKGLEDFLTPQEEAELRTLEQKGRLPESVDFKAVERYIHFCYQELLPKINKNREAAGLPVLSGKVLGNAILGARWRRDRQQRNAWYNDTKDRVFAHEALMKAYGKGGGNWGHARKYFLNDRLEQAAKSIERIVRKGKAVPALRPVVEYYTYRDASNVPYGYVYSVRLEIPTIVTGAVLEDVISKHSRDLAEFVYRELPEAVTKGVPFADLDEEKRAFYQFCVKKSLEGLGISASLLG